MRMDRLMMGLLLAAVGLAVAGGVIVVSAISVVLLYVPVPLALMLGAGLAVLALHEPKWALLLTFATMPFERMMALFPASSASDQGLINTLTVTKLMLLVVIVVWLLRVLVLKDSSVLRKTFSHPSPALALIFVFYTTISLIHVVNMSGYLKNQSTIVSNVVLFLLVLYVFDDKVWIRRAVTVQFFGYILVGLMGIYEVYTQTHVLELMGHSLAEQPFALYGESFRPAGPSGDPDYFATSVLYGLMFTLAVWRSVKSRLLWGGLVIVTGIFVFNIFATGSRGATLAFLVAMAVFFWFLEMPYKVAAAALAAVGGIGGFTLYTLFVSARTAGRYTGQETKSIEYRLGWQHQSFAMIEENPILGVGIGNNLANQHRFFDPRPPRKPENTCNTYAQLASEAGIPGVLIYIAFYLATLLYLCKVILLCGDVEVRHLATCFLAALSAFFLFAATAHGLYNETTWSLLGLSVGLGQGARPRATAEQGPPPLGRPSRPVRSSAPRGTRPGSLPLRPRPAG